MTDLWVSVVAGAAFGLALAAPPGPMNAVIATESVVRGWTAGFRAGLGAMTADACFFALALLGAVRIVEARPTVRTAMVGVGGLLMLYFAYGALRDTERQLAGDADAGASRGFRKAFALSLTNPYQIVFWLTVGVGLLEPGRLDPLGHLPYAGAHLAGQFVVQKGSPALIVGFFLGIALWIVAYPAVLVGARERVDSAAPLIAGASALVLGGFGVAFLADAVGSLL